MTEYSVGQVVDTLKGHDDIALFEITGDVATLLVLLNRPTEKEIQQFLPDKVLELRFMELYDVIALTARIGSLGWMGALYSPHITGNLAESSLPVGSQALACRLILVDSSTGEIKNIRSVTLPAKFAGKLLGASTDLLMKPFDKKRCVKAYYDICARYSADQISRMSKNYCRFG